jgi:hypothetical protein
MSFEIIFAIYSPIYLPAHEIQVIQPQYSAQDLGPPIAIGEKQNLSINLTQSQINLVDQLQFNSETLSEGKLLNPGMIITLKEIEQKFGQIDSVSTDIRIASVESKLELNSQDLETEMTFLSVSGFRFQMKGELETREQELKFEPVLSFKQSFNWFEEQTESEDKEVFFRQAIRFALPRRETLNSAYLNSLSINQENEIDDTPEDIQDLTRSLNSLTTSQLAKKTIFSLEGDLEDLSAKLKFPVPGALSDELQLKITTNLPEVLVNGEDLPDKMKSTLSLRYRIAIDDATKLEIQNSYNLRTTTHETFIRLILK